MKKKLMVLFLVVLVFLTGGCGNNDYIKDNDNKIVQYKETGQNLPNNILCKPASDSELYKVYEEYDKELKVSLKDLP